TIRGVQQIIYCLTAALTVQRSKSTDTYTQPFDLSQYQKTVSALNTLVEKSPVTEIEDVSTAENQVWIDTRKRHELASSSNTSSARSSPLDTSLSCPQSPVSPKIKKRRSRSSLQFPSTPDSASYTSTSANPIVSEPMAHQRSAHSTTNRLSRAQNRLSAPSLSSLYQQHPSYYAPQLQQMFQQPVYPPQHMSYHSQPSSPTAQYLADISGTVASSSGSIDNYYNTPASSPRRSISRRSSLRKSTSFVGDFTIPVQRPTRTGMARPYASARRHTVTNSMPPDLTEALMASGSTMNYPERDALAQRLPQEILGEVYRHLAISDLLILSSTSRWQRFAILNHPIWQEIAERSRLSTPKRKYKTWYDIVKSKINLICEQCYCIGPRNGQRSVLAIKVNDQENSTSRRLTILRLCLECRKDHFMRHGVIKENVLPQIRYDYHNPEKRLEESIRWCEVKSNFNLPAELVQLLPRYTGKYRTDDIINLAREMYGGDVGIAAYQRARKNRKRFKFSREELLLQGNIYQKVRYVPTKAAKIIELYKEYKDANIELEGFESQYNKILGIYKDVFNNDTFESISDYTYIKINSAKLVRFSAELLKEAISKPELKIKTWHVMPRPSNSMRQRGIFVAADSSAMEIIDKKAALEKTTKFSNAEYNEIPVVDSVNSSELLKYLRMIGRNRRKIFDFMKGYRHRETKAYPVQNRQITDNHMCDLVLGQTAADAPYTLAHRTNSKKRRKAKNTFKKASGIVAKEAKRTVIAYGDASLTGTKAGYTPIPVKVE
ncbi:hypothetical protein CU097_001317, partial [Rhizopus azygosporus]